MGSPAENILQNLFEISPGIPAEQLNHFIKEHPYYGAAYFLLAKTANRTEENGYKALLQKTAVHFPNEFWLHFRLNEENETVAQERTIIGDEPKTAEIISNDTI